MFKNNKYKELYKEVLELLKNLVENKNMNEKEKIQALKLLIMIEETKEILS
jgi:hypothetical protein